MLPVARNSRLCVRENPFPSTSWGCGKRNGLGLFCLFLKSLRILCMPQHLFLCLIWRCSISPWLLSHSISSSLHILLLGCSFFPLSILPVLSLLPLEANKTLNCCFSRTLELSVLSASSCFGESVGLFLSCSIDLASLSSKPVNNSFQVVFATRNFSQ